MINLSAANGHTLEAKVVCLDERDHELANRRDLRARGRSGQVHRHRIKTLFGVAGAHEDDAESAARAAPAALALLQPMRDRVADESESYLQRAMDLLAGIGAVGDGEPVHLRQEETTGHASGI